jgi:hypothetical protein
LPAFIRGFEPALTKGTGYRQQLFKALVEPHKEALFETGIALALSGNETMLRLFLERMLPSKPNDEPIDLDIAEGLRTACGLLESGENVLKAVSQGQLTPQQAKAVMATIEMQRKNVETCEIVDRVAAIERVLKGRK